MDTAQPPSLIQLFKPGFLSRRRRAAEWMDEATADQRLLEQSLTFLRRTNRLLGYNRSTIHHLRRFSGGWQRDQTIRILDVGTGSADVPRAILKWAARLGWKVRAVGVDLHASTARAAADGACGQLSVVRANALHLPFPDGSFDYAICSLFLHHLDEADVCAALAEMRRVARRGIIAGDIVRSRGAYLGVWFLSLLANPMVRHDGRLSVAQAFSRQEIVALRDAADCGFAAYHRHFGARFVLAGEKADAHAV